jgi:DNA-binding NtrC family response regulator
MPHLGGPDLYKKLNTLQPELKVLFMSGYARTSEGFDASLPSRFPFIEKPFTTQTLTSKIRDVLDG